MPCPKTTTALALIFFLLPAVSSCKEKTPLEENSKDTTETTDTTDSSDTINTNDSSDTNSLSCEEIILAAEPYDGLVDLLCTDTHLHITTATALPDPSPSDARDQIMIGIQNWIQRMPIPTQIEWELPRNPNILSEPSMTTGLGPIAVAINGVPIFHFEKRPLENIEIGAYTIENDTVQQGELDQCGGHAGQGEDYHYHYAPLCLLNYHNPDAPIAFSLDGLPIYFGTGGDDFFGRGRYSELNFLPDGNETNLDQCNSYTKDDGEVVYYTTAEPPYVLGCHRAEFDRSLQRNILFGRAQGTAVPNGTLAGEPISTLVTDFTVETDGSRHLVFNSLTGTGSSKTSVVQTDTTNDCWTFTFRNDENDAFGITEEYCR